MRGEWCRPSFRWLSQAWMAFSRNPLKLLGRLCLCAAQRHTLPFAPVKQRSVQTGWHARIFNSVRLYSQLHSAEK